MFEMTSFNQEIYGLCEKIETHQIEHIMAYTTLLTIKMIREGEANAALDKSPPYESGEYNNQRIELYPHELDYINSLVEQTDPNSGIQLLKTTDLDENLDDPEVVEKLQKTLKTVLEINPGTPLYDFSEGFPLHLDPRLEFSLDFLVDPGNKNSTYCIAMHLIVGEELNFREYELFARMNPSSSPKLAQFSQKFTPLKIGDLDTTSILSISNLDDISAVFTIFEVVKETGHIDVQQKFVGFLPLKLGSGVLLQGFLQIPLVEESIQSCFAKFLESVNQFDFYEKLDKEENFCHLSDAFLMARIRCTDFEGCFEFNKSSLEDKQKRSFMQNLEVLYPFERINTMFVHHDGELFSKEMIERFKKFEKRVIDLRGFCGTQDEFEVLEDAIAEYFEGLDLF